MAKAKGENGHLHRETVVTQGGNDKKDMVPNDKEFFIQQERQICSKHL